MIRCGCVIGSVHVCARECVGFVCGCVCAGVCVCVDLLLVCGLV